MEAVIVFVFGAILVFVVGLFLLLVRSFSRWNRNYDRLASRYAAKKGGGGVMYGLGLSKPSLRFDYGRTFCTLKNRKSFRFASRRQTELRMIWPNRRLRFEISTSQPRSKNWMQQVEIDDPQFQADFYVSSNDPVKTRRMLSAGVQWQIQQIRRHMGDDEVVVSLRYGNLVVRKPGYIKSYVPLEDFVRFSLELFDQFMLINADGIEFINVGQASVVEDVKCPICSEEITANMVVCSRCKTPHCQDCWQYNGQCATFACSETRCIYAGAVSG
ncbi:MAG: hypothetical protein ACI87E_001775 [Mariniblastus sp.]|jgi:hypothetical protein